MRHLQINKHLIYIKQDTGTIDRTITNYQHL